ncbi:hypothetical protein E2320_018020 [Naja naja]|nr:hypothetical protein E2320_018020 [Naja naja]
MPPPAGSRKVQETDAWTETGGRGAGRSGESMRQNVPPSPPTPPPWALLGGRLLCAGPPRALLQSPGGARGQAFRPTILPGPLPLLPGRLPQEDLQETGGRRFCAEGRGRPSSPSRASRTMERSWVPPPPPLLLLLLLGLADPGCGSPKLELGGRHVCAAEDSLPPALVCCPGWKQVGPECPLALCLGADACQEREICVRPAVCRCRPGFFGANCNTRCPEQFWGPDCKQNCRCHPQGRCHPASGECSCHLGWWGPLCQSACLCGQRGHCHPVTGTCRCDPGWWAPDCRRQCQCNLLGSHCDPATGRCLCHRGWWGRRCASLCSCNGSPCAQESGRCECTGGGGQPASTFASVCTACAPLRMDAAPVMLATGAPAAQRPALRGPMDPSVPTAVATAETESPVPPHRGPAWPATLAGTVPTAGSHALWGCTERTAPSRAPATVSKERLANRRQDDAGTVRQDSRGPGVRPPVPLASLGRAAGPLAPTASTGAVILALGPASASLATGAPAATRPARKPPMAPIALRPVPAQGEPATPSPEPAQAQGRGPLLAGIVGPLLLLLLLGLFCCQRCHGAASVVRAPGAEQDLFPPVKHRLMAGLPSLPSSWPCFSRGGSKLPRVTVAHRDPEVPFNPSFIEPMSTAWPWDSSFSSSSEGANEETGGCQEGPQSAPPSREALPEGSLLPGAATLHPSPFAIPRTSSLAKGKRPSVSFAEGTHFGPQSLRAPPEALNPAQKPRPASESSVQGAPPVQVNRPMRASCHSPGRSCYENVAPAPWEDSGWAPAGHHPGSAQHLAQRAGPPDSATVEACIHEPSITTIYVTVGQARRGSEEPPPAAQQHQGAAAQPRSLQKLPWKARDAAKGTSRNLAPEKDPSTVEAQGLLAPDEEVDRGGSSGSLEP